MLFRIYTSFGLWPAETFFYPTVKYRAFDVSDLLAEFGGLMGLLAGISVFSIIELVTTVVNSLRLAVCKNKVSPKLSVQLPKIRKKFLVNQNHLFYYLSKTFVELLKESSIHGVHYTNNKRLHVIEKLFWLVIICVLLIFCSILVFNSLKNMRLNSVIIAVDEKIWGAEDVRALRP